MFYVSVLAPSNNLLTGYIKLNNARDNRDLDQAKADLISPRHLEIYKSTKAVEDLPALGQWYCVECSRWFETESTLLVHQRGKPHKRRLVGPCAREYFPRPY
jgi:hypothetical protein